jgi:1,4-alpha-glucan branching enzyme
VDSDAEIYGGHGRLEPDQVYFTQPEGKEPDRRHEILAYLPTRTALVLRLEK